MVVQGSQDFLADILQGDSVHIVTDDADHSSDAILKTMESFAPHLSDEFIYFVEDNRAIDLDIRFRHPSYRVERSGELTIITSRPRPAGGKTAPCSGEPGPP